MLDIKKLLSFISQPKLMILNVGCGDGRDNIHIEKNGGKAIGIDLSEGMLKEANKQAGKIGNYVEKEVNKQLKKVKPMVKKAIKKAKKK